MIFEILCGGVLVSTANRSRRAHAVDVSLATLKLPRQKINANTIDSDENIARLLAQAEDIKAHADDFVPETVEAVDEALV
jgi:hypothetical protein